jgi:putative oxidoreductase
MKKKIIFVVSLLFGLMMINGGLDKFLHYMRKPEIVSEKLTKTFGALMEIGWLMPLVGIIEIIGGILIIIPKTRALGAIVILPVMVGIMCTNIFTDTSGLPIGLAFFAINLWVIYENRNKYMQLFNDKL